MDIFYASEVAACGDAVGLEDYVSVTDFQDLAGKLLTVSRSPLHR